MNNPSKIKWQKWNEIRQLIIVFDKYLAMWVSDEVLAVYVNILKAYKLSFFSGALYHFLFAV